MSHINELEDFVNGLVSPVKMTESDFDMLSLSELEALMGIDLSQDDEKVAYLTAACNDSGGSDRYKSWLDQFVGTPLYAKAIQLCEQELALEQDRLQKRIARDQELDDERETWTKQDMLRLQKDMLQLELHKFKMRQGGDKDPTMPQGAAEASEAEPIVSALKEKNSGKASLSKVIRKLKTPARIGEVLAVGGLAGALGGAALGHSHITRKKQKELIQAYNRHIDDLHKQSSVQMVGQVNNGVPSPPEWPRAALGVDSAGRRATPEEERAQAQTGGDGAFRQPEKGSKTAGRLLNAVKLANADKFRRRAAMIGVAGGALAGGMGGHFLGKLMRMGDKGIAPAAGALLGAAVGGGYGLSLRRALNKRREHTNKGRNVEDGMLVRPDGMLAHPDGPVLYFVTDGGVIGIPASELDSPRSLDEIIADAVRTRIMGKASRSRHPFGGQPEKGSKTAGSRLKEAVSNPFV